MQTNASTSAVAALFPQAAAGAAAPAGFGDLLAALTQATPATPAAPARPAATPPGAVVGEDEPAAGDADLLSLLAPANPPQGVPILVPLPAQVPPAQVPPAQALPAAAASAPVAASVRPQAGASASAAAGAAAAEAPAGAFVASSADAAGNADPDVAAGARPAAATPSPSGRTAAPAAELPATTGTEAPAPAAAEPRKPPRRTGKEPAPSSSEPAAAATPSSDGGTPAAEPSAGRGPVAAAPSAVTAPQAAPAEGPADAGGIRLDAVDAGSVAPHLHRASAEAATGPAAEANASPASAMAAAVPPAAQIAVQVARGSAGETIVVSLKPAELGTVEVSLELGADGRMSAHVAVERPETLELIQRDAPQLERALQDAGIDLAPDALTFDLRQDGQASAQQRAPQEWPGRRQAFRARAEPELGPAAPSQPQRRSVRLLDLSI